MLATTDCGMSPAKFMAASEKQGEAAYREANIIAKCINDWADEHGL